MGYSKKVDYFEMWREDRQTILCIMFRNMNADLCAGYNPFGPSITRQMRQIDEFRKQYDDNMKALREKTEEQANRWCYVELLRTGVIE